ncbi:MAG: MFS transporter [Desulfuromonadales bacterium]|nr:MFS transporter [Desulfuromonadales bacterium]MDT8424051.1 MFS transporter [Desulfuromonadales bacterium]
MLTNLILGLTTVLTISALYAPQPLLPAIVAAFGVTPTVAATLTSVTFLPLALAPLFYGYILEVLAPRTVLLGAVALLTLSEVAFYFAPTFALLIALRLFQGLLIPALLTALMTYVSRDSSAATVQRRMAAYIAATILGGFLGRSGSGLIATLFGWRFSFLVLAFSLVVCFVLLLHLPAQQALTTLRPAPRLVLEVLREPVRRRTYLAIFCMFLVFAAIMNFIPFRLLEISSDASEFRIGLIYVGYIMGIVMSLNAVYIRTFLGGEIPTMAIGLGGMALALAGMVTTNIALLFISMFVFCGAMFLTHATASGWLNRRADDHKGIVNGLYVAFYYGGGVVGSWLPGYVYHYAGWTIFLLALMAVAGLSSYLFLTLPVTLDINRDS